MVSRPIGLTNSYLLKVEWCVSVSVTLQDKKRK